MKKHSKTLFRREARNKLLKGAEEVYKALSTTLGARGRNMVLWQFHQTRVQHDGYTIAKYVNPKDSFENAGATIIKQAANNQVDEVGDGTTVTVVLARQIAREAEKIVESGVNPMALRSGLEKGRDILTQEIDKLSEDIKTKKQKIEVATISSEDKQLGELIGSTLHKVGLDGVVTVEEASSTETYIEHQDGMQIDSGYKSPYLVTNPQKMTSTIRDAKVLVTDYVLDDIHKILPLYQKMVEKSRGLVIFCKDMEGSALASTIQNKMEGKLNVLVVKVPTFQQDENLQDIATVLGAEYINKQAGYDLKKLELSQLGGAEKVTASREATIIVGGKGKTEDIEARISAIKTQIEEEGDDFKEEKLRERLAKLTGGVYTVMVGGHTEVEIDEKKERAKDAVLATKAAIEEGIVPGGEVVYLPIIDKLEADNENDEYAYRILRNALKKPFEKLVENAGLNAGRMMAGVEAKDFGWGVDVTDGKIKELKKEGIIDPAKVSKEAIKNAVSVAIQIITSDGIVAEIEEKDES